jgi:hypothetical protein
MERTPKKINYLNNRDILKEIHKSKCSYCYFTDVKYQSYDYITYDVTEVNKEKMEEIFNLKVITIGNSRRIEDKTINFTKEDMIFRVMTTEHVPDIIKEKKVNKHIVETKIVKVRTNFPAFKHNILKDGKPLEVGRSHWKGDLETGEFCMTHGKLTNTLAIMYMKLVDKYSNKGNWRGYTYVDEMKSYALLQLTSEGLQFNEARTSNPFAFFTQTVYHAFTRTFNLEKKIQTTKDDILIMTGSTPSYSRQLDDEKQVKVAALEKLFDKTTLAT